MGIKALSVHGHFYQPPREDPLTGLIPVEEGASPFPNWNERIHRDCYLPNALQNNFEKISFNIGPTLWEWMSQTHPETCARIVEQDQRNVNRYGVGNAIAQAYNHTILPLSSRRDKETQVVWGIEDFNAHFGHKPQGMWLPECAVDTETLEVLAENGIQFTILAPWQANTDMVDTTQAYHVDLPSGRSVIVFFYNQSLSTTVSFDPSATSNADLFITQRVLSQFGGTRSLIGDPQLVMVASDGELYGHHQPFRDKFLGYLLNGALAGKPIQATYPGLWLLQNPVQKKIGIRENSSWSCHHSVDRWKTECGCTEHAEWKQPLRAGLEKIGAELDAYYEREMVKLLLDPWKLRNDYIHVVNQKKRVEELLREQNFKFSIAAERDRIGLLLRSQYERQRMFTSCGWFFEDFDRIEPRNNVRYAAQACWLLREATGVDLTNEAEEWLRPVKSWRSGLRGDSVFHQHLQRAVVVAAGIRIKTPVLA